MVGAGGGGGRVGNAGGLGERCTAKDEKGLRGSIVGVAAMKNEHWLASSDGLVLAFKGANFMGDRYTAKVKNLAHPMIGVASTYRAS